MKEPELEDFGILPEEYTLYKTGRSAFSDRVIRVMFFCKGWHSFGVFASISVCAGIVALFVFADSREVGKALFTWVVTFLLLAFIAYSLTNLVLAFVESHKYSRLKNSSIEPRIRRYEVAEQAYTEAKGKAEEARLERERIAWEARRKAEQARQEAERVAQEERRKAERAQQEAEQLAQEELRKAERAQREAELIAWEAERIRRRKLHGHWMSLSGPEFERELGTLYKALGYIVQLTPTSGDQGIDLILQRDGKTSVVQCKSHKQPIGPAIARELYGSMVAFGADDAILACTGGFTRGVQDFVRGKPITLVSASELAEMGRNFDTGQVKQPEAGEVPVGKPRCPELDCNSEMVRGAIEDREFWRCIRHPKCRGVLPICPNNSCENEMFLMTSRGNRSWVCIRHPECSGTRPYIERSNRVIRKVS